MSLCIYIGLIFPFAFCLHLFPQMYLCILNVTFCHHANVIQTVIIKYMNKKSKIHQ